jgi:hypothetical protein
VGLCNCWDGSKSKQNTWEEMCENSLTPPVWTSIYDWGWGKDSKLTQRYVPAVILHKCGAYRISVCGRQIQFPRNMMSIFWCALCKLRNWTAYNTGMLPETRSQKLNEGADSRQWKWSVGTWPLYGAHTFFVTGRKLNNNKGLLQGTTWF